MAEATLVKEVLTDDMIAAGAAVTRTLDAAGWPIVASPGCSTPMTTSGASSWPHPPSRKPGRSLRTAAWAKPWN